MAPLNYYYCNRTRQGLGPETLWGAREESALQQNFKFIPSENSSVNIIILSRVGDRPTATILQVQFHFLIFALFFKAKYSTKICPS